MNDIYHPESSRAELRAPIGLAVLCPRGGTFIILRNLAVVYLIFLTVDLIPTLLRLQAVHRWREQSKLLPYEESLQTSVKVYPSLPNTGGSRAMAMLPVAQLPFAMAYQRSPFTLRLPLPTPLQLQSKLVLLN